MVYLSGIAMLDSQTSLPLRGKGDRVSGGKVVPPRVCGSRANGVAGGASPSPTVDGVGGGAAPLRSKPYGCPHPKNTHAARGTTHPSRLRGVPPSLAREGADQRMRREADE